MSRLNSSPQSNPNLMRQRAPLHPPSLPRLFRGSFSPSHSKSRVSHNSPLPQEMRLEASGGFC